jgi:hypothetical protein
VSRLSFSPTDDRTTRYDEKCAGERSCCERNPIILPTEARPRQIDRGDNRQPDSDYDDPDFKRPFLLEQCCPQVG